MHSGTKFRLNNFRNKVSEKNVVDYVMTTMHSCLRDCQDMHVGDGVATLYQKGQKSASDLVHP